ncbi:MAG: hypothetical protein QMC67_12880 [Candidatus Wallbacteria bacterium]
MKNNSNSKFKLLKSFCACTTLFFCLSSYSGQPVYACTDVLNAFLSVEKLNETLKNELVTINNTFQYLDVALSQNNSQNAQIEIDKLINAYFDFYIKYFQNPPAQFIDDTKWHDKLSLVNSNIKVVHGLIKQGEIVKAHSCVKTAYEAFSAIYKDRVPMSEQNVIDMIISKVSVMEGEMKTYMAKGGTNEVSIHANNLKALVERLANFESSNEIYITKRSEFINELSKNVNSFIQMPITDTTSCTFQIKQLSDLKNTLEVFLNSRKATLNEDWFKQNK